MKVLLGEYSLDFELLSRRKIGDEEMGWDVMLLVYLP
jgi:hypothetical protein